jgi:hypothetical protein
MLPLLITLAVFALAAPLVALTLITARRVLDARSHAAQRAAYHARFNR